MPYYSDAQLEPVLLELADRFEMDLTSATPIPYIARECAAIMRDRGMEPRKPVCLMLAKRAKAVWFERIMECKASIDGGE